MSRNPKSMEFAEVEDGNVTDGALHAAILDDHDLVQPDPQPLAFVVPPDPDDDLSDLDDLERLLDDLESEL